MLTVAYATKLYSQAILLPHGDYVKGLSIKTICETCNGVGAEWMAKVRLPGGGTLLDLANKVHAWAKPPTLRHDVRYYIGGTKEKRAEDDQFFLDDCLWWARYLYEQEHWYNPMRYIRHIRRRADAILLYTALRSFGWMAYNFDTTEERLEDAYENNSEHDSSYLVEENKEN